MGRLRRLPCEEDMAAMMVVSEDIDRKDLAITYACWLSLHTVASHVVIDG